MSRKKQPKVIATDFHRNGMGGEGFQVSIVEDENGRMLVIDFNPEYVYVPLDERTDYYSPTYGYTAVLNLDKAAAGNIHMFPEHGKPDTGGNAWRGDRLGDEYRPLIRAASDAQYAAEAARLNAEREASA